MKRKKPSKKYLIMRMEEYLSIPRFSSGRINHKRCLELDISMTKYSWKEIEKEVKQ